MNKYDMLEWNGSEWVLRGNLKGEQGDQGETGNGIASAVIDYAIGSDGTTIPTSDWSTTIPSVPQGQYLWTRTTTQYTDNTSSVAYSVARQGMDGGLDQTALDLINSKQDILISGSNIKTVNGESILGSGDVVVGSQLYRHSFTIQNYSTPVFYCSGSFISTDSTTMTYNKLQSIVQGNEVIPVSGSGIDNNELFITVALAYPPSGGFRLYTNRGSVMSGGFVLPTGVTILAWAKKI